MPVIVLENELMTLVNEFSRTKMYKGQKPNPTLAELKFLETKLNDIEYRLNGLSKLMNTPPNATGSDLEKNNELLRLFNKLRLQVTDEIKIVLNDMAKHKGN